MTRCVQELQEAAAGAIGNMAAEDLGDMTTEDDEVRETIRNNGAVQPLVRMLDTDVSTSKKEYEDSIRNNYGQIP